MGASQGKILTSVIMSNARTAGSHRKARGQIDVEICSISEVYFSKSKFAGIMGGMDDRSALAQAYCIVRGDFRRLRVEGALRLPLASHESSHVAFCGTFFRHSRKSRISDRARLWQCLLARHPLPLLNPVHTCTAVAVLSGGRARSVVSKSR